MHQREWMMNLILYVADLCAETFENVQMPSGLLPGILEVREAMAAGCGYVTESCAPFTRLPSRLPPHDLVKPFPSRVGSHRSAVSFLFASRTTRAHPGFAVWLLRKRHAQNARHISFIHQCIQPLAVCPIPLRRHAAKLL